MDKRDTQILNLLGENCRLQNQTIAKATNLSKDTIKNRIQSLEKNKIITHYNTILDLRTLGFSKFQILIKLKKFQNKEKLIETLQKNKSVTFINTFIGKYDLHIIIDTKDIYSFDRINSEILNLLEDQIQDYTVLTFFSDIKHTNLIPETTLDLSFNKKSDSSFSTHFSKTFELKENYKNYKADKKDLEILKTLTEKPRISLVDLSKKIKLNREAAKQRIVKLIKEGVIKNFGANISFDAFSYTTYFILLKTNKQVKDKVLRDKFSKIENLFYSAKVQGDYSLITYVLAKTPTQLKETIKKLQDILESETLEIEIMIFDEIHHYTQFPENALKELEAKTKQSSQTIPS